MRVTFLGTGTSHGIPMVGCECAVCTSPNSKNNRLRCSVLVRHGDAHLLVDTATEFRIQAIRHRIRRLDAIVFTHAHADHIGGLDDVRVFSYRGRGAVPIYGDAETLHAIRTRFDYVFMETQAGGGKPQLSLQEVTPLVPLELFGMRILPVPVHHGELAILALRFEDRARTFAYVTDVSSIPEESKPYLCSLDVLVLDALRHRPHPTHFSLEEAISAAHELRAGRTYFTHMAHDLEHEATNASLPPGMELAYDGLEIELDAAGVHVLTH
jgi:phosphoribosyl 1,2-cyclic phosphate phosphodiesterase